MKTLFPTIFLIIASLLALISIDFSLGKPAITYLENMKEGFATLIVGILGFGGLSGVAWYNSHSNRLARNEERSADVKENADGVYVALCEFYSAYLWCRIGFDKIEFRDDTDISNLAKQIRKTVMAPLQRVSRTSRETFDEIGKIRGLGEEIVFRAAELQNVESWQSYCNSFVEQVENLDENQGFSKKPIVLKFVFQIQEEAKNIHLVIQNLRREFGYCELPGFESGVSRKHAPDFTTERPKEEMYGWDMVEPPVMEYLNFTITEGK